MSGTMTPFTPSTLIGTTLGQEMWPPLPYTLLPLADYARIMGINPIQFMSGTADNLIDTGCADRWLTYTWQDDEKVSRYDLAVGIARAERDIATQLGRWPVPAWVINESHPYPQHYRRDSLSVTGLNGRGRAKSVQLKYDDFYLGGTRATEAIGTATTGNGSLVFSDEDSDGIYETATIQLPSDLADVCEARVFYAGYDGKQEYEIRPIRYKRVAGGVLTIVIDAWLLFDPDKLGRIAVGSGGFSWLNASVTTDFVSSVDVYRVYNDPTESATLYWERHPKVADNVYGELTEQNAALVRGNTELGFVSILPGAYDGDAWTSSAFAGNREPDHLVANYMSGIREEVDVNGCWRVPTDIVDAIVMMATARLTRHLCTRCENVRAKEKEYKRDLTYVLSKEGDQRFITRDVLTNPFGTRYGEVEAWRIVRNRMRNGQRNVDVAIG